MIALCKIPLLLFVCLTISCDEGKAAGTTVPETPETPGQTETPAEPGMMFRTYKHQWDESRLLENPYKGWYHHYYSNGLWAYGIGGDDIGDDDHLRKDEFSVFKSFPGMDHLYLRIAWSYFEPEEGRFDWTLIDEVVDKYVPLGYGLSFRITCRETGGCPGAVGEVVDGVNYATPKWVRDAGANGTDIAAGHNESARSWSPDYGDPVFLEKLDNFHRAFAARYDGKPWVRYVDIGSVGDWGEGHTHFSVRKETPNDVIKKHIDIYCKHYKQSLIVAVEGMLVYLKEPWEGAVSGNERIIELANYCKQKGVSFRSDSFLVDYYMQISTKTWSVTRPYLFEMMYGAAPIVYELEHYSYAKNEGHWIGKNGAGVNKYGHPGATFFEKSMEISRASYIGYHGYIGEWFRDNPDFSVHIANRVGYWYFPVSATYPDVVGRRDNTLTVKWANQGVAPAYNVFGLRLHFVGADETFVVTVPESRNLRWMPGQQYSEKYFYDIPDSRKAGEYDLYAELYDESLGRRIGVGLAEKHLSGDGLIPVGKVRIE